ncbi:MAG: Rieske 2Fe-2S domain-containing protein [Pseudomonadota bacterium]|nr:Rieske 2Fe-2S domain-containing protein [Pseudomonadota bacterium]
MKQEICRIDEIPEEGSLIVPFFEREVHVFRSDGHVRAIANVCMHFGGPLECANGKFTCPWHGASYDMNTLRRVDGPAPPNARLMALSTVIEDGILNYVWGE